ncbi:hypothetical protein [Allosphingosinicella sp.]|jgi:hypothetical protein|uniref:hypothetical protein n=1 Tax=Allosphingosinicella sp. TaxID=2823234 RepID=UPI002EE3C41A
MRLHDWFGRHVADLKFSHWDCGHFVSRCTQCGREMIKLPGLTWRLRESQG